MRILFGPEHDGLHVDPSQSGAYEWWYFDALSDDGRYALVVIYFLGSPMTPYYRAVVDGKKPQPMDWCGVFVSLHEKRDGLWREKAYAYNLYRNGEFAQAPQLRIGESTLEFAAPGTWTLSLREKALWAGETRLNMTVTVAQALQLPPAGDKDNTVNHAWVCVAPLCRAQAKLETARGETIVFAGSGYHDHNFGYLPWADQEGWYWGRANRVRRESALAAAVFYRCVPTDATQESENYVLLFDDQGELINETIEAVFVSDTESVEARGRYGFVYPRPAARWMVADGFRGEVRLRTDQGALLDGPFYRRLPLTIEVMGPDGAYLLENGIGEVFRPASLCGPIASRAMWTRIRRR